MQDLIISISGVRGIAGQNLTAQVAARFGRAFGQYLKATMPSGAPLKVVIGRDTRHYGIELFNGLSAGLDAEGVAICNIGIVPTPTVQLFVTAQKSSGGIIITASHNPKEWNGLKFVSHEGIFLNQKEGEQFLSYYEKLSGAETMALPSSIMTDQPWYEQAAALHLNKVLSHVDVSLIKKRKLKVAMDCANGAGGEMTLRLLKSLGCDVIGINMEPKGDFNRSPEPIPANIQTLCDAIKTEKADIGFAQDADADRLAIVDETGRPIGEDNTLVLAVKHILSLSKNKSAALAPKVVTNLSTTMAIDDIAREYDATMIRTKVGEINVSMAIKNEGALIGGEGNGGVIWPVIGLGRDSLAGIALILELLATENKPLSTIMNTLPRYVMVKDKVTCTKKSEVAELLAQLDLIAWEAPVRELNKDDGVKIVFQNSWIHVRGSNTEPIARIIAEAPTEADARGLIDRLRGAQ